MDDSQPSQPKKPRKTRGPYMSYYDPSNNYVVPRSTVRDRHGSTSRSRAVTPPNDEDESPEQQDMNSSSVVGGSSSHSLEVQEASSRSEDSSNSEEEDSSSSESKDSSSPERASDGHISSSSDNEDSSSEVCAVVCVCSRCTKSDSDHQLQDHTTGQQTDPDEPSKIDDRYGWNDVLMPGLTTTKFDVYFMVLHLVIRHGLTGPLIEDILKMVNVILGENVIPSTKYMFYKVFKATSELTGHFYCLNCECYLGVSNSFDPKISTVPCPKCGTESNIKSLDGGNCFITFSMKEQLEQLLKRPDFVIIPHLDRSSDVIRDVMDGMLYQKLCEAGNPLANPDAITITFNTDGVATFENSKGSLWPIQFFVNETLPEERFKSKNVLLAGLYFGKKSPNMSMFLKPFVTELQQLAEEGIKHCKPDGTVIYRPVFGILCSVDSVARPKVQNMRQFNGGFGCGYCYHPNLPCAEVKQLRYLATEKYRERTHSEVMNDMLRADALDRAGKLKKTKETDDAVNGIKGISILLPLPGFHAVWGFPIDYFHAVLEGQMESLADLWINSNLSASYNINSNILIVNKRLSEITPPRSSMGTSPRSLDSISDWKAKDWRSFLLYYCLPCLEGILPSDYFENLRCLVHAMFILLSESVSQEDLKEASDLLDNFVEEYNKLYGDRYMVYNTHIMSHLAMMVSMFGLLWAYSTFPFESGNGHLLKLVNGTRGVISQIAKKYLTIQSVPTYLKGRKVSKRAMEFCGDVISYEYVKNSEECEGVTGLGSESRGTISDADVAALENANLEFKISIRSEKAVLFYNRVVREGILYYSRSYSKPKKFDDSCVVLDDNSYAVIDKIVKPVNQSSLWALVKPISLSSTGSLTPHVKRCALNLHGNPPRAVPFSNIIRKCVKVSFDDGSKNFVCDIPNLYERD